MALTFLVMGRSAEGDVVEEVSTKQEGVVAKISRDEVKVKDMEMEEVVASELLGDLHLELGRKLLLQGGLEVDLGHILVRVRERENFKDSKTSTRKLSRYSASIVTLSNIQKAVSITTAAVKERI